MSLLHRLPALGCVLYLPGACSEETRAPRGCLLGGADLQPLLRTHWLAAAGEVTTDGPHEWIECVDVRGITQARLHLLPDTDYLAWDRLLEAGEGEPPPACARRRFQPASVRLCSFDCRSVACMRVFDARQAPSVSAAGERLATQVARMEGLPLQSVVGA